MVKKTKHKQDNWTWIRIRKSTVKKLKFKKLEMDAKHYDEVLNEILYVQEQK